MGGGVLGRENGYTLIAVLLTLVLVSALSAAGFLVAMSDYRVSENHEAAVHAFYAAEAGLRMALARTTGHPPDSQAFASARDTTIVRFTHIVELGGGRSVYLLSSRAVYRGPEGSVAWREIRTLAVAVGDPTVPLAEKPGTWYEVM